MSVEVGVDMGNSDVDIGAASRRDIVAMTSIFSVPR